jgi:hypothetical protein
MSSLLESPPAVNPRFTRPTKSLAGCGLFRHVSGIAVLTLATGRGRSLKTKQYLVEEVPTQLGGRAFRLTPSVADTLANNETEYVVLVAGADSSCTCPGHGYTGGCKHLSSLLHFTEGGAL